MRGLHDRVVVVAGGATGIGAATAQRLAEEGAKVVIGDINIKGAETTARMIEAAGGTARAVEYDQSDESSIAAFIAQAVEHFGTLHGLHTNANEMRVEVVGSDLQDLLEMDVSVWEWTLRVGLIGHALLIREAVPHLLAAGGGGIVCTSSDASALGLPRLPAYSATKAGINALVRHVASRWGKDGIRANAISPGVVQTESAQLGIGGEAAMREKLAEHRSHRLGEPADIAAIVAYLLSDDGEWVNGQVWSVDGGHVLRG